MIQPTPSDTFWVFKSTHLAARENNQKQKRAVMATIIESPEKNNVTWQEACSHARGLLKSCEVELSSSQQKGFEAP